MTVATDRPLTAPGPRCLTKSEFLLGLRCHRALWWRVHEPGAPELAPDRNAQALMASGRLVGTVARDRAPGGVLIGPAFQGVAERTLATARALGQASAIYEATFAAGGLTVSADILERTDGGWTLVEVKGALAVKAHHVTDAAIQAHVLRQSGVTVDRVEVMHLNRDCRHPELGDLFVSEDVTEQVAAVETDAAAEARRQLAVLDGPLPDREIGPHCEEGGDCPFKARCWPTFAEHHVSTMYYAGKQWWEWRRNGWHTIADLPATLKLKGGAPARRQVQCVREGRTIVEEGLASALDALPGPRAFLDFETVALPIPAWPRCGPLMAVPVQFSCHVEDGRGGLTHHGWLADGPGDPRPELARRLVDVCASAKSVVAYYAAFERKCLQHLAEGVPELAAELHGIEARLVDLLPVVRDHVYHPAFGGSFSLKRVFPALMPEAARYAMLDIAEGETASNELVRLLFHRNAMTAQERHLLRDALQEYCRQDTFAMVRLFERLEALSRRSP